MALRVLLLVASVNAIRRFREIQFEQKTVSGCSCVSMCMPSRWDKFTCDICTTKGCGKRSIGRRYDLCSYPIQETFEAQSADEKMDWFWNKIMSDTQGLQYPEALVTLKRSIGESVHTSFDNYAPEMPKGRGKPIHSVGAVAKITMTITDSPYTGILGDGTHKGLIRMGSASSFDEETGGLTPGFGFKFPRSGIPSGDFVAMRDTNFGHSYNFFAVNISNHIPPPAEAGPKILGTKFEQGSICASMVGLSDLAKYTQSGEDVGRPKFPFKLFFMPTPEAQMSTDPKSPQALGAEMAAKLTPGTPLYTVYACAEPAGAPDLEGAKSLDSCGGALKLGSMTIASETTMSTWGDEFFHIRHQRIEEDWKLEPSFEAGSQQVCGRNDKDWSDFKKNGGPKPCVGCMRNSDILVQKMDGKGKKQSKGGAKKRSKGVAKKSKGRTGKKSVSAYTCFGA